MRFKFTMASPLGLIVSSCVIYYLFNFICGYIPEDEKIHLSIPWGILAFSNGPSAWVWHLKGKFEEAQKLDGLTISEKNRLRPRLQRRINWCITYIVYNLMTSIGAALMFYICSDNGLVFKHILPLYGGSLGATIFGFGILVSEYNRIKDFSIEISDRQAIKKAARDRLEKIKERS